MYSVPRYSQWVVLVRFAGRTRFRFIEAPNSEAEMRADIAACSLPQLSNQVEYSKTPLLGKKYLADLGSATGLGLDPAVARMVSRFK